MTDFSKITEAKFRDQVVRPMARRYGWLEYFAWKSIHSPAGYPDLTLCRPPELVIAELKVGNNKVTPAQREWLEALAQVKVVKVFTWRHPDDLEEIARTLTGLEVMK